MSEPFEPLNLPNISHGTVGYQSQNVPGGGALMPLDIGIRQEDIGRHPESIRAEIDLRNVAEGSDITGQQRFLAFAAALSGNFAPAIALQEQQRKAKMSLQLFPVMNAVGKLETSGKHDEAAEALTNALAVAESKAPGLVPPLQMKLEQINKKRQAWNDLNTLTDIALTDMSKDHPDRGKWEALAKANKNRSAMSSEMVKEILPLLRPHIQTIEGATRITGQLGGTQSIPLEPTFEGDVLKGNTGLFLAQMLPDVTPEQVTALLRGRSIVVEGQTIEPTPENQSNLRSLITSAQSKAAQLVVGQGVQLPPETQQQQIAAGVPAFNVAARTPSEGMSTTEFIRNPITAAVQRLEQVAAAPITAKKADKGYPNSIGITGISLDPATLGQRVDGLSFDDMEATNGKIVPFNSQIVDTQIRPAILAMQGLSRVEDLWNELGNPLEPWNNVSVRVNRTISRWTGIPLGKDISLAEAAALSVRRGIEEVEGTGPFKEVVAGLMKDFTTGNFANAETARETVRYLQSRLQERLRMYINENTLNQPEIQKRLGVVQQSSKQENITKLAQAYNVNEKLALAVSSIEWSGTGPARDSSKGAVGDFQIIKGTAEQYGFTEAQLRNKKLNPTIGMHILQDLQEEYPNRPDLQLAAYHSGKGNIANGRIINPNKSDGNITTKRYVEIGLGRMGYTKEQIQQLLDNPPVAAPTRKLGIIPGSGR